MKPAGSNRGREIGVVGGGIGGLTAALAFARRGARVTVLERAPNLREQGAGIQLTPNGHVVLNALGLGPALEGAGESAVHAQLRDGRRGTLLARWALPKPWRLIHRGDLLHILARACETAHVEIETAAPALAVEKTVRRPVIRLRDEETFSPELVVAADGIRSATRSVLNGRDAPIFLKQSAWRATVVPKPDTPAEPVIHLMPGRHVVTYPIREGSLVNIVAVQDTEAWTEEGWDVPDTPDSLRAAFLDASPRLGDLLERVTETRRWALFGRPVAEDLGSAGIALLGDAAHPTLPFLAQGANLAIEDAWILARETDEPVSIDRALRTYADLRRPRLERAIRAAHASGGLYHAKGVPGWIVRGGMAALGRYAPKVLATRYAWLHEHDVTNGETLEVEAEDAQLLAL